MCEIDTPCDHFKSRGIAYTIRGGEGYIFSGRLRAYFTAMAELGASFQKARSEEIDYEFLTLVGLRRADLEANIIPMHFVSHPRETSRDLNKKN